MSATAAEIELARLLFELKERLRRLGPVVTYAWGRHLRGRVLMPNAQDHRFSARTSAQPARPNTFDRLTSVMRSMRHMSMRSRLGSSSRLCVRFSLIRPTRPRSVDSRWATGSVFA